MNLTVILIAKILIFGLFLQYSLIMVNMILCGLTANEIFHHIKPSGFSFDHALAISNSVYKKRVSSFSLIPKIPKKLIKELESDASMGFLLPVFSQDSADGTVKYLFRTESGKEFETVYIPDGKRATVCVSTQSGCRMNCPLCVTGRYGYRGNLSAGEIVNQVISIPDVIKVSHVVFMGMGEPMDNLENVLKACEILTSGWGVAISPRNITVSTVGITPGIEEFLATSECNLTVSLYSPFPAERILFVPVEKRYPVKEIIGIMREYPLKKKRRMSIAYVMIKDQNDTDNHLEGLRTLLLGSKIRVNLLSYHMAPGDINTSSSGEKMQFFKHSLVVSGISASIRKSRGIDISAACGLLAAGLDG
jgi:23S rRNA (adenine2503-C2)-methyltransferase